VRRFVAGGAEVLFNISNDGWFGKSAARAQHLSMVRMRAAENRRWILRSTNDGITATIDSAGRLRGTLPPSIEATSYTGFSYVQAKTVYTRFGDWFPLLCATLAVMRELPERRMESAKREQVKVDSGSLIYADRNVYSVPSRLIGEQVEARLFMDHVEVWYGQKKVAEM